MPSSMNDEFDTRFSHGEEEEDIDEQQEQEQFVDEEQGDHEEEGEQQFSEEDDDEGGRNALDHSDSTSAYYYEPAVVGLSYPSESAEILSKKYMERDQVKMAMEQQERDKRLAKQKYRQLQLAKWQQKTSKSPFRVNLVAENERLDEESKSRAMEDARRSKELTKRSEKAKQEVILKALTESPDLELLRREKRAIIDEERRLKALMDLEKTNSHRKMDLIAAKNAEKKRRQEKEEYRRQQKQYELEMREQKYKQLLKEKLAIED